MKYKYIKTFEEFINDFNNKQDISEAKQKLDNYFFDEEFKVYDNPNLKGDTVKIKGSDIAEIDEEEGNKGVRKVTLKNGDVFYSNNFVKLYRTNKLDDKDMVWINLDQVIVYGSDYINGKYVDKFKLSNGKTVFDHGEY